MDQLLALTQKLTPDDFNKLVLALVALISLVVGPLVQFSIARRQLRAQEAISKRQVELQEEIAKRQAELQQQVASRQIADSIASRRQTWIDKIREDCSEMVTLFSKVAELRSVAPEGSGDAARAHRAELQAAQLRAHELGMRVRLRLNPTEAKHIELVELVLKLGTIVESLHPEIDPTERELQAKSYTDARRALILHLQGILKDEWERVKRGEV